MFHYALYLREETNAEACQLRQVALSATEGDLLF